jgi:hypothetical protein
LLTNPQNTPVRQVDQGLPDEWKKAAPAVLADAPTES